MLIVFVLKLFFLRLFTAVYHFLKPQMHAAANNYHFEDDFIIAN